MAIKFNSECLNNRLENVNLWAENEPHFLLQPRLTVPESAEYLQVSKQTVYRWIENKQLQAYDSNGVMFIPFENLYKFNKNSTLKSEIQEFWTEKTFSKYDVIFADMHVKDKNTSNFEANLLVYIVASSYVIENQGRLYRDGIFSSGMLLLYDLIFSYYDTNLPLSLRANWSRHVCMFGFNEIEVYLKIFVFTCKNISLFDSKRKEYFYDYIGKLWQSISELYRLNKLSSDNEVNDKLAKWMEIMHGQRRISVSELIKIVNA